MTLTCISLIWSVPITSKETKSPSFPSQLEAVSSLCLLGNAQGVARGEILIWQHHVCDKILCRCDVVECRNFVDFGVIWSKFLKRKQDRYISKADFFLLPTKKIKKQC